MRAIALLIIMFSVISCQSQSSSYKLDAKSFQEKINTTPNAVLIDVRTAEEFSNGYIAGAVNMDYRDKYFETRVKDMDVNKTCFVYCLSGGRSASAADFMRKNGFKNVYELNGGMMAWNKAGLAVTNDAGAVKSDKISAEDYKKLIASDKTVLIDFYAPWCGPCKQMLPLLEQIGKEYQGKATIIRINIDENKNLTKVLGIDEIPFFKLYKNGEEKGNFIGQLDRATFERILK